MELIEKESIEEIGREEGKKYILKMNLYLIQIIQNNLKKAE
jgi:hypothetical protein